MNNKCSILAHLRSRQFVRKLLLLTIDLKSYKKNYSDLIINDFVLVDAVNIFYIMYFFRLALALKRTIAKTDE